MSSAGKTSNKRRRSTRNVFRISPRPISAPSASTSERAASTFRRARTWRKHVCDRTPCPRPTTRMAADRDLPLRRVMHQSRRASAATVGRVRRVWGSRARIVRPRVHQVMRPRSGARHSTSDTARCTCDGATTLLETNAAVLEGSTPESLWSPGLQPAAINGKPMGLLTGETTRSVPAVT
jgi:hypothetical protein